MSFHPGEVASLGAAARRAVGLTPCRRDVKGIGARQVYIYKGLQGAALFLVSLALGVAGSRAGGRDVALLLLG